MTRNMQSNTSKFLSEVFNVCPTSYTSCPADTGIPPQCTVAWVHQHQQPRLKFGLIALSWIMACVACTRNLRRTPDKEVQGCPICRLLWPWYRTHLIPSKFQAALHPDFITRLKKRHLICTLFVEKKLFFTCMGLLESTICISWAARILTLQWSVNGTRQK